MNTIFALCSAYGKAGVSVFRISGPNTSIIIQKLVKKDVNNFMPRKMYFCKVYDPYNDIQIDESMVVMFHKDSSFTGEESAEIHVHGSIAVIKLLNAALTRMYNDVRLAEPGEFTKRSFLNGKMDLTSAEGLADLIDSETILQHQQAITQLGKGLAKIYDNWREKLIKIIALLEAYIDFPDEDIPEETLNHVDNQIKQLKTDIGLHLDDNNRGERLRSGLRLAIIGRPNVGKSSLINYLMNREVSIVSDLAGTTRDVIEGHIDIGGYPIILQDTAGINNTSQDIIEQKGIQRAHRASKDSDIRLIVYDASNLTKQDDFFQDMIDDNTIILVNKSDLSKENLPKKIHEKTPIIVSIKNNLGLNKLLDKIIEISENIARPSETPQITRARHRVQLEQALQYLSNISFNNDLVLTVEDIRMTIRSISNITGKITVDEILGEIFSNFCIGK